MSIHGAPTVEEIDEAYKQQGGKRFICLENPAIDDAWGVYDYDTEIWVQDPYYSKQTAQSMCISKNKGAKRL